MHRIVLRLDVDVAGAPLDGREDRPVDQLDDRAVVAGEALEAQVLVAGLVLAQHGLELLGRLVEQALRALALLQDGLDGRRRPHHHANGRPEQHAQLVDHRQVGRVRHHDDDGLALAAAGDEPVPQHEVGGDRPEELLVDPELRHVEELQPVALGQPPGLLGLGGPRGDQRRGFGGLLDERVRVELVGGVRVVGDVHQRFPSTEVSWKSGM
ncbi:MAG: hypothetical protein R2712_11880 [Vicinamibacterales bacterium]